jgi:hypothetical protein
LLQSLQVAQLILFALPILALIGLGVTILIKPLAIINRRWYLMVVLPLLFANLVAIIENNLGRQHEVLADWLFWLILGGNAIFLVGSIWLFKGFQVFGLDGSIVISELMDVFNQKGYEAHLHIEERQNIWRESAQVLVLTIRGEGQVEDYFISEKVGEVSIRAKTKVGAIIIKECLRVLDAGETPYDLKWHAVGILFIVLAVVMAVLGWIFFFEPRLILID